MFKQTHNIQMGYLKGYALNIFVQILYQCVDTKDMFEDMFSYLQTYLLLEDMFYEMFRL